MTRDTAILLDIVSTVFHFAQTPHTITGLMARYCASLGAVAV
jgi:hypothetical protein